MKIIKMLTATIAAVLCLCPSLSPAGSAEVVAELTAALEGAKQKIDDFSQKFDSLKRENEGLSTLVKKLTEERAATDEVKQQLKELQARTMEQSVEQEEQPANIEEPVNRPTKKIKQTIPATEPSTESSEETVSQSPEKTSAVPEDFIELATKLYQDAYAKTTVIEALQEMLELVDKKGKAIEANPNDNLESRISKIEKENKTLTKKTTSWKKEFAAKKLTSIPAADVKAIAFTIDNLCKYILEIEHIINKVGIKTTLIGNTQKPLTTLFTKTLKTTQQGILAAPIMKEAIKKLYETIKDKADALNNSKISKWVEETINPAFESIIKE